MHGLDGWQVRDSYVCLHSSQGWELLGEQTYFLIPRVLCVENLEETLLDDIPSVNRLCRHWRSLWFRCKGEFDEDRLLTRTGQ